MLAIGMANHPIYLLSYLQPTVITSIPYKHHHKNSHSPRIQLLVFQKGVLSGIFRGVLNTTLVQLTIFCFSFLYLGMSHYDLWRRPVLCGDQTIDLQDELTGWFLYGLGFRRWYFLADYSIVLILEAVIAKCPFVS